MIMAFFGEMAARIGTLRGDLFGGFAAMLVALPSAIAYGLIVYAPLGAEFASAGAVAGLVGSVVMGILAPLIGGTSRMVSAPCAPAAALLSAFAADAVAGGTIAPEILPLCITLIAMGAGIIQIGAGLLRGGTFIKFIPYPVVTGYLSGVGVLIFVGQLPGFLGLPRDVSLARGILEPGRWSVESIIIGSVTIAIMLVLPRIVKAVPASIAALAAGIGVYFILSLWNPALLALEKNPFVVGTIHASFGDIAGHAGRNIRTIASIDIRTLQSLLVPIISLGVLLSIDTLKTCVVLDVMTGSRHHSNRELFGQGASNMVSALMGGMPGSGTMGGTLVNFYSGGKTRFSGIVEGICALLVLVFFARLVAWVPLASLAGVLLVVAVRMLDRKSIELLKHRSTLFDFAVILAVVISAVALSLIAAAGVGIAFAIILFLRDQVRFPVVRHKIFGNQAFSKKNRPPSEQSILLTKGSETLIVELQGQLFFGTTDQLYTEIEPFIGRCRHFILDMRRVLTVDFTAANMLSQLKTKILESGGDLSFSSVPQSLPTGLHVRDYLQRLGFSRESGRVRFFPDMDEALEWVEDEYIREAMPGSIEGKALILSEFDFFEGFSPGVLNTIAANGEEKQYQEGDPIFARGDRGGEIYFIKKGEVRIEIMLPSGMAHHLATFGRGAFFGDMSFLDRQPRSADAKAVGNVELFILNRRVFNRIVRQYPEVAGIFYERLSLEIARRLRINVMEQTALDEM